MLVLSFSIIGIIGGDSGGLRGDVIFIGPIGRGDSGFFFVFFKQQKENERNLSLVVEERCKRDSL